jgi:hypothetical protein
MAVKEGIIQILNDSQSSLHNHQKLLRKLKALYEQHQNVEDFFETFFLPFTNALVVYKREPAVERVIDFVAKFAVSTAPIEKQGREGSVFMIIWKILFDPIHTCTYICTHALLNFHVQLNCKPQAMSLEL